MNDISKGEYKHAEAFALMWYACPCGHRERIWNSRDGVTPFGTRCPSCGGHDLTHAEWKSDARTPLHKLLPGQRFWRDGTIAEAEAITRKRVITHFIPEDVAQKLIKDCALGHEGGWPPGWPMLDINLQD